MEVKTSTGRGRLRVRGLSSHCRTPSTAWCYWVGGGGGGVGSGLLVAERQFRKVIGYRQIPTLLSSMANAVSKKPFAKGVAVA